MAKRKEVYLVADTIEDDFGTEAATIKEATSQVKEDVDANFADATDPTTRYIFKLVKVVEGYMDSKVKTLARNPR